MGPRLELHSTMDTVLRGLQMVRGSRPRVQTVERRAPATPEEFEAKYRHPPRPVVFEGGARDWPAVQYWSPEWLVNHVGHRQVSALSTTQGFVDYEQGHLRFGTVGLGDTVRALAETKEPNRYLIVPLKEQLPELLPDIVRPPYVRGESYRSPLLWVSGAATWGPLHRELLENCFVQVQGRKRFILFAPWDSPWLYGKPFRTFMPHHSRYNPEQQDWTSFPLAREATPIEVVLNAGDILYLPSRWWHQVRSLDFSISVNFWWSTGSVALAASLVETVKRIRGALEHEG